MTEQQLNAKLLSLSVAIANTLPPQKGNAGKILSTNGTKVSWVDSNTGSGGGSIDNIDAIPISGSTNAVQSGGVYNSLFTKVDKVNGKGLSTNDYSTADRDKLAAIPVGATANSSDAALRDRATHTGTQLASTISNFQQAARASFSAGANIAISSDGVISSGNLGIDGSIVNGSSNAVSGAAVYTALSTKVDKVSGKQLSTEDYSTNEKAKLSGIATAATANSSDAVLLSRNNHIGVQNADTIVDGTTNKVYTATEKIKLQGIATGATVNSTDAVLLSRANHVGTQSADTIVDGTTNRVFTSLEKSKLSSVAAGATANSTDAQLRDRTTHTGTQPISTVTGLQVALDAKASQTDITSAINTLKGGVSTDGDTLNKVYNIALGAISETTVANIAARNAYNVTSLPKQIFVLDDGDGNWATYKATTTGVGATYVKISDYNTVNSAMSASSVKSAYESNADTNAFTDAFKTKLTGIATGATANSSDAILLSRANHTGTQSTDTLVDGTTSKVFLATEKTKLASIASGATANSPDATLLARANHTGTQSADTLTDGGTNKVFLASEKTKLQSIASGATVNSSDATLLARTNHTGTQLSTTISDFNAATDARIAAQKNAINGVLALDAASKFSADFIIDGTTNRAYTGAEKTKLSGIATGATANSTDATLLNRANHTGTQLAATISNFNTAVAAIAPAETAATIGVIVDGATAKTTLVDADGVSLSDSAASGALKKATWLTVKTNIKNYYDAVATTLTSKTLDFSLNTASNIPMAALKSSDTLVFDINGKQDVLVSGVNIKTIGGVSILGPGNIASTGGSGGSTSGTDSDILVGLGAPVKYVSFGVPYFTPIGGQVGVDLYFGGEVTWTAIYLPAGAVLTGLKYRMSRAGDYTATNFNGVALFSYAGGTLTRVAISANVPNAWKGAAQSYVTTPFTNTYTVPASGVYYTAAMYSASAEVVTPQLVAWYSGFDAELNQNGFANGAFINGKGWFGSSMPTSIATSSILKTNAPDPTWVGAY